MALSFALVVVVGGLFEYTIWSLGVMKKRLTQRRCFCTFLHLFPTILENFIPRSSRVRSPGHDRWPYFQSICGCAVATVFNGSIWNVREGITVSVSAKLSSRNFDSGNLRSGQFCDLIIIRQWENIQMPFPKVRLRSWLLSKCPLIRVIRGHMRLNYFVCL